MTTREYKNYKRMAKMTVRFLENHESNLDSLKAAVGTATASTMTRSSVATATSSNEISISSKAQRNEFSDKTKLTSTPTVKKERTPPTTETNGTKNEDETNVTLKDQKPENGRYTNWTSQHNTLASLAWCCIGDLMAFCDKYEYRTINRNDLQTHSRIVAEVKALLSGQAPFDMRKRFPTDIRSAENLWVCIGRCTGVEYHLNRILGIFRRPMDKLPAEKQRMLRHDFHLAVNELRLDISARISEVRLYDRNVFEREFRLEWQDESPTDK